MTIIDISPRLSPRIAVWPGDVAFSRSIQLSQSAGSNIDLSSFNTTVHVGAHADAPSHYHATGRTIEQVALEPYWGSCLLVRVDVPRGGLIQPDDCSEVLRSGHKRVLFSTGTFPDPENFNEDFAAFSPAALEAMGKVGVVLVGIDTPSVDPFASKDLPGHQMLLKYKIANLEGLVLDRAKPGVWELCALPLSIEGSDGSPVRAALRSV